MDSGAVVPRRLETVPQLYLQPETPKVMLQLLLLLLLLLLSQLLLLLLLLYLQPETPKVMLQSHKAYESNPDAVCDADGIGSGGRCCCTATPRDCAAAVPAAGDPEGHAEEPQGIRIKSR